MNLINASRKIEVQLIVDHPNLSSNAIEDILQLPSDISWNEGEYYKPSKNATDQRYLFSRWAIQEAGASLEFLAETIENILVRISAIEDRFAFLPENSRISLTVFANETNTVIGLGLEPKVIKLLSKINSDFEFSLILEI